MNKSLSLRLAQGATLIAEDRLDAAQLETVLLSEEAGESALSAWRSPRISTRAEWTAALWARTAAHDRSLLTVAQSAALWRRIIADSPESWNLVDSTRIADWAAGAWQRLCDACVDHRALRADAEDTSYAAFLSWARSFDEVCRDRGWIDPARLPSELTGSVTSRFANLDLLWVEPLIRTPGFDGLLQALADRGSRTAFWTPAVTPRGTWQVGLPDRREELIAAARWAQNRLDEDPSQRLVIVALAEPQTEQLLDRIGGWADRSTSHLAGPTWLIGKSAQDDPAIGAALSCIELVEGRAGFDVLSRWLRSPFLGDGIEDRGRRSLAEAELRSELLAQLPFGTAYRHAGLRAWIQRRLPQTASVLDVLLAQHDSLPARQSATRWAGFFADVLSSMGWPGSPTQLPQRSIDQWNEILRELAQLSPVLGAIGFGGALSELNGIVARYRNHVPVPLRGLSVMPRIEDVGYGYDAAWITGMSDRIWPRAAEPNPLLPLRLQAIHGMPLATPGSALQWSRNVTTRLVGRVPEIVFSYPSVEDEFAAAPSPLIREFPVLPREQLPSRALLYHRPNVTHESIEDLAPAFAGSAIAGGARTLGSQARCPLRAFVESRLAAKPLETVSRGLGPRHRGIATHRALELLMRQLPGRAALAALSSSDRAALIRSTSREALSERARGAERALRVFVDLERDRLTTLLDDFLAAELERDAFTIVGLEIKQVIELCGLSISCRVDRLDRLRDGRIAIIDYKTGQRASPLDWLKPRLPEPQLPLYASAVADDIGALVIAALQATGISYRGIWTLDGAFPARPQALPPNVDWAGLRERWMHGLTELVTEFATGDTRISASDHEPVAGPFAPLTRVHEALVAFRGFLQADDA